MKKIYKIIGKFIAKHFDSTFQFSVEQTNLHSDKFEVLDKSQREFRKEYSIILYSVIHFHNIFYSNFKQKPQCMFVDFEKAFDNVW